MPIIAASFLALFMTVQPLTVSGPHLLCNKGKCPKMACLDGWEYRGYDMNGRLFMTCRTFTTSGHEFSEAHMRVKNHVRNCF
jgi:hypothetical protein